MIYRRRSSALHAARAGVGCAYCGALALVAMVSEHPLVLLGALLAVLGAGLAAQVGAELRRAAGLAVSLAVLIALINPLVTREGLTVIFRGGTVPWLGRLDVTLEAVAYGGVLGLRVMVIMLCFGLYSAAVDPDEVLRLFRRVSFRSALSATLATRMVPVLARDARRLDDAQRSLPGARAPRAAVVRAVAVGALERAVDVAATLELRGYGSAQPPRRRRTVWSRHDLAFAAAAGAILALVLLTAATGTARFEAYPRLHADWGAGQLALAAALVLCALLPFLDRRGIVR